MKFFDDAMKIPKMKMKPEQEARIGVYCNNKHLIAYVIPTPFCIISIKGKCKICGLPVEVNGLEMELEFGKKEEKE